MTIPVFPAGAVPRLARRPWHDHYYAMYSGALGGIVTDPAGMTVPADDHVVHRGDGVFETIKCVDGHVYGLAPHLARLSASAERIGLRVPCGPADLTAVILATLRAGGRRDALVRVILSRGPGGFGVAPAECPEPGLYVIAYRLTPPFMDAHPDGAKAVTVDVPIKPGFLAVIKTCNYLPNALMKAAAHAAGADFPVAFDERGFLAEGATENLGIVTREKVLQVPRSGRILDGITVQRVFALAPAAVRGGLLAGVGVADIPRAAMDAASEILVFGTTPDVTAVVQFDGRPVGSGRPGPVQAALNRLLTDDIRSNAELRTPVG
ncbi:MAG: aminodeoxychorismate lyase [Lentisphaerae bacterium]|nr:aminodeoxychorismate lyase [Lentisphaerota bacterium]